MNVIEPLLALQETDGQIRELEREMRDIPARRAQETARLSGVTKALEIAKAQLLTMQQRIRESEEEGQQLRAKAQALKIAQVQIKSNKELQQSLIQVEALEHDADAAENRALAMQQDEIPMLEARQKDAEEKLANDKGGVDAFVAELDARLVEVKARLEELQAGRRAQANEVPPNFLLAYERLRTKRWPVVVTLNADGVCDGCHLMQPPSVAQQVHHNQLAAEKDAKQEIVKCTMCGRILYRDF